MKYSFDDNLVHYQNLFSTKIEITNFRDNLRKFPFLFFSLIWTMKDVCEKPRKKPFFNYFGRRFRHGVFKVSNPDSVEVNKLYREAPAFPPTISRSVFSRISIIWSRSVPLLMKKSSSSQTRYSVVTLIIVFIYSLIY